MTTWIVTGLSVCAVVLLSGCGTTRQRVATEQLVLSDAVDRSIQDLDFRPLSGRKVYLDSSYLRQVKSVGFVNAEYVISGIRQQIVAAGCYIQDSAKDADVIIEARIGALGADDHGVTLGIPENSALASAVSMIPNAPALPSLPEVSIAKREAQEAAAKIAAFAYDRETREPVWQSGVRHSIATARETWIMGIGPFQGGTIRDETKLAGSKFRIGRRSANGSPMHNHQRPAVDYASETHFNQGHPDFGNQVASGMLGRSQPPEVPPLVEPSEEPAATVADATSESDSEQTKVR